VPDISCRADLPGGEPPLERLHIEVTVFNAIDDERMERIRQADIPTLEIDLSLAGGTITKAGLRALVIDNLAAKRWLHLPGLDQRHAAFQEKQLRQMAEDQQATEEREREQRERREALLAVPLQALLEEYLTAVMDLAGIHGASDGDVTSPGTRERDAAADAKVRDAAEGLAERGYPESGREEFYGYHGILPRLLSIRLDRGVGYRMSTGFEVLNATRQDRGKSRSFHTLYMLAAVVYPMQLSPQQAARVKEWRAEVRASIESGSGTHLRDPAYDRLIALLFPEMAAGLAKSGGKRPAQDRTTTEPYEQPRERAPRPDSQSRRPSAAEAAASDHFVAPREENLWLRGSMLQRWMKENPEWARAWFKKVHDEAKKGPR